MKKEIIEVDKEKGIFRVTCSDERWYTIPSNDLVTGLPIFKYVPSVTWITGHYPKGTGFYKWLAGKGWDEAEIAKTSAGDKGSKIHNAIENLISGETIKMDSQFMNNSTEKEEDLKVEEYEAIMAFQNWANKVQPEFIANEITVISEKHNFAGTVDCIARINGQIWIIDFKTSQYVWPEMEIQISAYKKALSDQNEEYKDAKLAILQVGYKRNKNAYKFTEIEDQFELFEAAQKIWLKETKGQKPSQKDYPLEIKLNFLPKALKEQIEDLSIEEINQTIDEVVSEQEEVKPKKKSYYKSRK